MADIYSLSWLHSWSAGNSGFQTAHNLALFYHSFQWSKCSRIIFKGENSFHFKPSHKSLFFVKQEGAVCRKEHTALEIRKLWFDSWLWHFRGGYVVFLKFFVCELSLLFPANVMGFWREVRHAEGLGSNSRFTDSTWASLVKSFEWYVMLQCYHHHHHHHHYHHRHHHHHHHHHYHPLFRLLFTPNDIRWVMLVILD